MRILLQPLFILSANYKKFIVSLHISSCPFRKKMISYVM